MQRLTLTLERSEDENTKQIRPRVDLETRSEIKVKEKILPAAKAKNDEKAWETYVRLDAEIKTEVKKNKERLRNSTAEKLRKAKPHEVCEHIRKLLKISNGKIGSSQNPELNPMSFTTHMSTKEGEGMITEQLPFNADRGFEEHVAIAIKRPQK